MYSQVETAAQFDLASFEVDNGYFKEQNTRYEERYRGQFPNGWGEFFAAYSKGQVDKGNLDYDEWAFLCEHFMSQSWAPPGSSTTCHERPEAISGFFICGGHNCSIQSNILVGSLSY